MKPRILIIGEFMWPWYQEVCATALENLECEVMRFGWFADFWYWQAECNEPIYHSLWHRLQYRLHTGPAVWQIYRRLKQQALSKQPDIIWFYNVQLISPAVVKEIKELLPNTIFVQYANDNPFSTLAGPKLWRNYLNSIPIFDVHFSYRLNNILDYQSFGAQSIHMLRSYFIPEEDYPVALDIVPLRFKCDVVFAGHYEDDGRVEMLEAICQAGYRLNLFGGGWDKALSKLSADSPLRSQFPIKPVTKSDYRYAICGAKVALCFLSTLNQDTYTRRSFQIPAMQVAMLSQYSDDLAALYEPEIEAVFFRNKEELIGKLANLLKDDIFRMSVAKAGYAKVYAAGHDVTTRMKAWLEVLSKFGRSLIREG